MGAMSLSGLVGRTGTRLGELLFARPCVLLCATDVCNISGFLINL